MPRITPKDPGGVLKNSRGDQTIEPGSLLESCGVATAAIYYPGFHRSPDNDAFWGTGWTEWDHLRHLKADLVTGDAVRHPLRYYDIGADGGATLRRQAAQALEQRMVDDLDLVPVQGDAAVHRVHDQFVIGSEQIVNGTSHGYNSPKMMIAALLYHRGMPE